MGCILQENIHIYPPGKGEAVPVFNYLIKNHGVKVNGGVEVYFHLLSVQP
jgi:hypothetical protein